jgi:predicted nucleic acid-binding protein
MKVLFDTNVLTRAAQVFHAQHEPAMQAVAAVTNRRDTPCLLPQNLYEFWVVCTRPLGENGLGMDVELAAKRMNELKDAFEVLDETPAFRPTWEELVREHEAKGKSAHDTRLVAGMKVHGLLTLVTFNKQHFTRYAGLRVLTPEESLTAKTPAV